MTARLAGAAIALVLTIVGASNACGASPRDRPPSPRLPDPVGHAAAADAPTPALLSSPQLVEPPAPEDSRAPTPEPVEAPRNAEHTGAGAASEPYTLEDVLAAATRTFPEAAEVARSVTLCELGGYLNPAAFDLGAPHGGPMQLGRATWEPVFARFGWTWAQVTLDLDIHFAAARFVFDEALRVWGNGWLPWRGCL